MHPQIISQYLGALGIALKIIENLVYVPIDTAGNAD